MPTRTCAQLPPAGQAWGGTASAAALAQVRVQDQVWVRVRVPDWVRERGQARVPAVDRPAPEPELG
ncbi:MAG: hypothetical protein H0U15_11720 [Geodermatophilaceae bacterium]|nr:hypothetical protein [Geodermatophilaceae bacterium]